MDGQLFLDINQKPATPAMPLSRSLLVPIRSDRRTAPAPLVRRDGTYDRSAIMRRAVQNARTLRLLRTWRERMTVALRVVWGWAKREKAEAALPPVRRLGEGVSAPARLADARPVVRPRVHAFIKGSRIYSHGW